MQTKGFREFHNQNLLMILAHIPSGDITNFRNTNFFAECTLVPIYPVLALKYAQLSMSLLKHVFFFPGLLHLLRNSLAKNMSWGLGDFQRIVDRHHKRSSRAIH